MKVGWILEEDDLKGIDLDVGVVVERGRAVP